MKPKNQTAAVLLIATTIAAGPSFAQDHILPDMPQTCTIESVAGVFGFNENTPTGTISKRPLAFVGLLDLRADGTASIQFRVFVEVGGEPRVSNIFEGEWSVEPNCTGFIDFEEFVQQTGRAHSDYLFVAVENATELFFVRNNPLEEGDAKLLFRR